MNREPFPRGPHYQLGEDVVALSHADH
jgi:hypothetical protein